MTTHTTTERDEHLQLQDLPPLTAGDRLALAIGTRLILRTEQHGLRRAARAGRTEQARTAHEDADAATRSTFEHRVHAGPTW
jgi:hypothetical protein